MQTRHSVALRYIAYLLEWKLRRFVELFLIHYYYYYYPHHLQQPNTKSKMTLQA